MGAAGASAFGGDDMTPARKKALQWLYDQGEIECKIARSNMPMTIRMVRMMLRDGHLDAYKTRKKYVYHLTDAGRRALNGDSK